VKWYQLASKQGNARAMNNLGMKYAWGLGVEKDEYKAFQLVMESAHRDNPVAMKNLGDFYLDGVGCQRNTTKAMEWFQKAKENGEDVESGIINMLQLLKQADSKDSLSEYQLAEYYRKGEGLSRSIKLGSRRNNRINRFRNYKKAVKWFIKAAIHDQSDNAVIAQAAYYKLGTIFQEIAEDCYEVRYEEKAIKYYTMAANCGLPIAFCKLGEMYESHGEEKKAIEYYNRASDEAYFKYGIKTMLHS
jgi:TPR repeat protein